MHLHLHVVDMQHAAYAFRCLCAQFDVQCACALCSAMHDDESVQKMILICVQCTARMAQEMQEKKKKKISVTKIRFSRYALQVNIHLESKSFSG